MEPSTNQPTVCFGTMDPVDGGNADSTMPIIADSTMLVVADPNTLEALKQAVKIAREKTGLMWQRQGLWHRQRC
jgi:hypothetical protein